MSEDTSCLLLQYRAFECCYSPRLRVSRWAAYRYFRTEYSTLPRRRRPFVPDTFHLTRAQAAFPRYYDSVPEFIDSVIDQGHLAPDAAIKAFDTAAQRETYFLTNITPQFAGVNRFVWSYMEGKAREWAGSSDTVWVTVGPVFLAGTDTAWLGTRGIAIPHAHFCAVARGTGPEVLAFLVPNDSFRHYGRNLADYLVSVDSVEALTGLDLFPRLSRARQQQVESRPAAGLWR